MARPQPSRSLKALKSGFHQPVYFVALSQVLKVLHLFEHDLHDVRKIHTGIPLAGLLGLLRQFERRWWVWRLRNSRYLRDSSDRNTRHKLGGTRLGNP